MAQQLVNLMVFKAAGKCQSSMPTITFTEIP